MDQISLQSMSIEQKKALLQKYLGQLRQEKRREVAIIGLSGQYPQAPDVDAFWKRLKSGQDCISDIPKERWDYQQYFDTDRTRDDRIYCKSGGFLDQDIYAFDPLFFGISPREAASMDPHERLFLLEAWKTFEDAGYSKTALDKIRERVGVYVGIIWGNLLSTMANRVSYTLNLQGPSMIVDTACSSSLYAIHLARKSILDGECDLALAGGVNLIQKPDQYLFACELQALSEEGRCRSFGEGGEGYVPAEGVGCVLLKELDAAISDGDHIYGIIKGSCVNHDGRTNGYTVPNPKAQTRAIARAIEDAGISAERIGYIEAHGTGTSLGDPIEIAGLTKAFRASTDTNGLCAIGSVKSNIGHAEAAAGIAGLTKVLLQLKHRQLVPSLHAERLNPNIDFENSPFAVQRELSDWPVPPAGGNGHARTQPLVAGVSSFGAGGSNAHLIVEEYVEDESRIDRSVGDVSRPALVVLSARTREQLQAQVSRLLAFMESENLADAHLPDIAYTLQVGREPQNERLGLVAENLETLQTALRAYLDKPVATQTLFLGSAKENREALRLFSENGDVGVLAATWFENRNYQKLVELWVKGFDLDWEELYRDWQPRRISLPTYPFALECYRAPVFSQNGSAAAVENDTAKAPLPVPAATEPAEFDESPSAKPAGVILRPLESYVRGDQAEVHRTSAMDASDLQNGPEMQADYREEPVRPESAEPAENRQDEKPSDENRNGSGKTANAAGDPRALERLQDELAVSFADALYMNRDEVDLEAQFVDMGLDSIVGVEWVRSLNKQYGIEVPATRVYDYPTIVEFAAYLAGELDAAPAAAKAPASVDSVLREVSEGSLDPAEADRLLQQLENEE